MDLTEKEIDIVIQKHFKPHPRVIRYVRPLTLSDKNKIVESNLGGIAILFEINQEENRLRYSYAICDDTDNFDHNIATKIVGGRFNAGGLDEFQYDREKDLITNLIHRLNFYGDCLHERDSTLRRKLNEYVANNRYLKSEMERIARENEKYRKPLSFFGRA